MSLFCTPNVVVQTATTSATILGTTDLAQFTITAASNATLPTTSGQYAGYVMSNRTGGQGLCYVENVATSTANVTLVAASGDTNFGTTIVAPGQIVEVKSDGMGTNYCAIAGASATSGGSVQTAVVPLSVAQILALNSTPVSLIASPGTGKATKVLNIGLKMTTTSTGYANGGNLEFRFTDANGTKVTADIASGVVTAGAATSYTTVMGIEASLTLTTAAAIVVDNANAPFITGTGTGTFYVLYTTVG